MSYFRSDSRRPGRDKASSRQAAIEALESRKLLSAGPALTSVDVVGPIHSITGVVLTFNESLDTTTATDKQTFLFGKPTPVSSNNPFNLGDVLPFLGRPKVRLVKLGKIQWSSTVYDDTSNTVTLTPIKPFNGAAFIRVLRVKGVGAHALKDTLGNVINNGVDVLILWSKHQGKQVRWVDAAGDHVTLSLRGRGQIYTFIRKFGDPDPTIFIDNATSSSVLTGTVKGVAGSPGVANIAELAGVNGISTNLLNNPQFNVQTSS